jgi:hypothetical protein
MIISKACKTSIMFKFRFALLLLAATVVLAEPVPVLLPVPVLVNDEGAC